MIVVVHEAVGVTDPIVAFVDVLEGIEKIGPVLVALEDGFLFITAGCDMVDCTGILKLLQRQRIESPILAEEFIVFAR
jgi:hypothetical protein